MTREIPLTKGKVALVDDADYEMVAAHKWHVCGESHAAGYVAGGTPRKHVYMHRFILGVTDPAIWIDHKNCNGLDNRRDNLRICTPQTNAYNRFPPFRLSLPCGNKFKGVTYEGEARYLATITVDRRRHRLGYFKTAIEAARAYDAAAIKMHGEFARPNFPTEAVAA